MKGRRVQDPYRVLIYGSCVSRDTIEYVPAPVKIVKYIARQSLISIGNQPRLGSADFPRLESPFQQRVTEDDRLGNAEAAITDLAPATDLLLIDFTDERGGVYDLEGRYLTRSVERVANGADELFPRRIAFGTPEHFLLWSGAFERFVATLRDVGLLRRTLALAVPWATVTTTGDPTPESFGMTAGQANGLFEPYDKILRRSPINVVRPLPWTRIVADPDHKWGLAPFHYTHDVYQRLAQRLETRLVARESSPG